MPHIPSRAQRGTKSRGHAAVVFLKLVEKRKWVNQVP
jgi:hypothetical protein